MRPFALILFCLPVVLARGEEPTGSYYGEPGKEPKTWQDDLRYMVSVSHAEPVFRSTFLKLSKLARQGSRRKVTKENWYSLFSIPGGIIGFRVGANPSERGVHPHILVGVHASPKEPPPLPFPMEAKVGGVSLLSRKSVVRPQEALGQEQETYFGEKCIAHYYGAGHWITRYFVRDDRIVAISFALEP
jgi:hypothetical protein